MLRVSYLTVNAKHLILAEERKDGVNDDRIPEGALRLLVIPGENIFLRGNDAVEFRRQLDEFFPRRPQGGEGGGSAGSSGGGDIIGRPCDPITGEPLPDRGDAVEPG